MGGAGCVHCGKEGGALFCSTTSPVHIETKLIPVSAPHHSTGSASDPKPHCTSYWGPQTTCPLTGHDAGAHPSNQPGRLVPLLVRDIVPDVGPGADPALVDKNAKQLRLGQRARAGGGACAVVYSGVRGDRTRLAKRRRGLWAASAPGAETVCCGHGRQLELLVAPAASGAHACSVRRRRWAVLAVCKGGAGLARAGCIAHQEDHLWRGCRYCVRKGCMGCRPVHCMSRPGTVSRLPKRLRSTGCQTCHVGKRRRLRRLQSKTACCSMHCWHQTLSFVLAPDKAHL